VSEYTPTTDLVRQGYVAGEAEFYGRDYLESEPEFDRWLKQVKAEAWDEGYRTCDRVWAETADIVTSDECRTDPNNPYRRGKNTLYELAGTNQRRAEVSDKRLSEIMSDTIYAISQAQETLDDAITEAINMHFDAGIQVEQERIIKLLEKYEVGGSYPDTYNYIPHEQLIALIKGEQKPIHTHDIEVFGSPCDCGTRHEYCGECDWVEPCEPEGEQK